MIMRQKRRIVNVGIANKGKIVFDDDKHREVLKVILKKQGKFRTNLEIQYILKFFSNF